MLVANWPLLNLKSRNEWVSDRKEVVVRSDIKTESWTLEKKTIVMVLGAVIAAVIMLNYLSSSGNSKADKNAGSSLSAQATKGKSIYEANCSACHSQNGSGTDKGPPLIHKIYEPSHHGDASFQRAAKNGVRAHHWPFGNMPPVPTVNQDDVALIVKYIRELQRANGIR